jgi:uncharacterized protein
MSVMITENKLDKKINWKKLHAYVKEGLKNDKTGHDYEHTGRVLNLALDIAEKIKTVDYDVLVAAALLHDIAYRHGYLKDHHLVGAEESEDILKLLNFSEEKIKKIKIAIEDHVGIIGEPLRKDSELLIESKILRDADNIDALGSIGIIRMISFCTSKNYHYFISKADKFGESIYGSLKGLLEWPNKMLTSEGKKLADSRLPLIKDFLKQIEEEYA